MMKCNTHLHLFQAPNNLYLHQPQSQVASLMQQVHSTDRDCSQHCCVGGENETRKLINKYVIVPFFQKSRSFMLYSPNFVIRIRRRIPYILMIKHPICPDLNLQQYNTEMELKSCSVNYVCVFSVLSLSFTSKGLSILNNQQK